MKIRYLVGASALVYGGVKANSILNSPSPYDFTASKHKPKTIAVVGSGMVGLMTAYYLATGHPENKIVMIES